MTLCQLREHLSTKLPLAKSPLPTLRKQKRAAAATPATLGLWVVQAVVSPCAYPDPRLPLAQMVMRLDQT